MEGYGYDLGMFSFLQYNRQQGCLMLDLIDAMTINDLVYYLSNLPRKTFGFPQPTKTFLGRAVRYLFFAKRLVFWILLHYFSIISFSLWKLYFILKSTIGTALFKTSIAKRDTTVYCDVIDSTSTDSTNDSNQSSEETKQYPRSCYWNGYRPVVTDFMNRRAVMAYVNNCANSHICNDKNMFISLSESGTTGGVETVAGTSAEIEIGIVRWIWRDDHDKLHTFDFQNCRYMPDSPVNVLAVCKLGLQLKNTDRETACESGIYSSTFVWNERSDVRTIRHGENMLPQIIINDSDSVFAMFFSSFQLTIDDRSTCSCMTSAEVQKMDALSLSTFLLGQSVVINDSSGSRDGLVVKCLSNDQILVRFSDGVESVVDRNDAELCAASPPTSNKTSSSPETPMGKPSIPSEITEHIIHSNKSELLLHRVDKPLDRYQQELLSWHYRLAHLPFPKLIELARAGVIPRHLAKTSRQPLCASCIYGKAHKRPWRIGSSTGHIRKEEDNFPGACVSVGQLESAQDGLVPQQKGNLTHDRIIGATVFTDNFSG